MLSVSWPDDDIPPRVHSSERDSDALSLSNPTCLWARGLIANRPELERELGIDAGRLDTGTLLAELYEKHGPGLCERLEGTCSFVLWDPARHRLLAVAARTGHHRLYLVESGESLHVAGSVAPLLEVLPSAPLDDESVALHLSGRAIPVGSTFFRGIRALPPGRALTVGAGTRQERVYWRPELGPLLELDTSEAYAERLWQLLGEVVGSYLSADRIAIALSGGFDSASIAAAARSASPVASLTALRVRFPALPAADEDRVSARVAQALSLHDASLDGSELWPLSESDFPAIRPGSPATLLYTELWQAIMREAGRAGARIVMTGSGGDEGLGANVMSYRSLLAGGAWREAMSQLREHGAMDAEPLVRTIWRRLARPFAGDLWRGVVGPRRSAPPWLRRAHHRWVRIPELDGLGRFSPLRARVKRLQSLSEPMTVQAAELTAELAAEHDLLVCDPFLDRRLVEFALSLPVTETFRGGRRKVVLRQALRHGLPDPCLRELGKVVPTPLAWSGLREFERAKVERLLTDMRSADLGFVRPSKLRESYESFRAGQSNDLRFWPVLGFEAWLRSYA